MGRQRPPRRAGGHGIPLGARVLLACHTYDDLLTERVDHPALTAEDARSELVLQAGQRFDPRVVEALVAVVAEARYRPANQEALRVSR
jgi:two-component system cell cycle response regulator